MDRDEQIAYLISIIEQMKETLEFYAEPSHWSCIEYSGGRFDYQLSEVYKVEGKKAQQTLKLLEK